MASVISSLRCLWSVSVALTCCFSSFLLYTASPEEAACRYLTTSRHVAVICPVTRLIQKYIHRCLVMFSVKVFFIIIPSAFFWSFLWFDPVLVCCLLSSPAGPQPLGLIGCFFFPSPGDVLFQMAEVHRQIQIQLEEMVSLLVPKAAGAFFTVSPSTFSYLNIWISSHRGRKINT